MKISIIGPTYPYKGGISHFTTLLVRKLRNKKNKVQFISWKRQYPSFLYPVEQKDTESKDQIKETAIFTLDFFNPITWVNAFSKIRKNRSELLILTWVSPIQAPIYIVISLLTKKFTSTKVTIICHNVLPHEQKVIDKPLSKLAFNFADSFIVHSEDDRKDLQKLTSNTNISIGFHPIYDVFNKSITKRKLDKLKKELKLEKRVLLFFGYIRPYKGLNHLINAMPKVLRNNSNTSLLIVGEFWSHDKDSYVALVKNLKIENNVIFIDKYVPNEEIKYYFNLADVVVLPYIAATQSGIIQIAYSFNKPVLSTDVGGLKDVVEDGISGYIIKPESEDIAKKVDLFFKKPISKDALNIYKEKFSWDRYLELL